MWGIVPAAGRGSRIQPLAFSKELLPVGSRLDNGVERPCAVSEYLVERMIRGGARKICFVISPGKSDIMEYYGAGFGEATIAYVVQPEPQGLCDAIFRAAPLIPPDEPVLIGLPDTIWFPESGLAALPDDALSFLLFPVDQPQFFDAVVLEPRPGCEIQVKQPQPASNWIWGAFKMPALSCTNSAFWTERERATNTWHAGQRWLAAAAAPSASRPDPYVDVGTERLRRARSASLARREELAGSRSLGWPRGRPPQSVKRG
jgi:hypothetical protein